jgi:hypothetical protein
MPRQNRVTPEGVIIADPGRGLFMGNRGVLHDTDGHLGSARYRHFNWVCCVLEFKNRRRQLMQPHHYTELFFLDEAVALAAGHRPCAECRRPDHMRFRAAWEVAGLGHGQKAPEIDRILHAARIDRGRQVLHHADVSKLPDGAFVMWPSGPAMVLGDALYPYAAGGYGHALARPKDGIVTVLTPKPVVGVLAAGYAPALHPSAA